MFRGIDLCSDTVTRPTEAMKKAMFEAELGDEQKGEDPTTIKLEEMVADTLGHTAAMFFPSAAMANEVAIRAVCDPGDELMAADQCHLFFAETGGPAVLSQVITRPIGTKTGIFSGDDIHKYHRWQQGPHYPISKMVSVENTTNIGGGIAWTQAQIQSVIAASKEKNLFTHMDGSRLFNAVVRTQLSPKTIASSFDFVTLCFSKGLGCPTGAALAFDKKYWGKIRRIKQLFGGCMRQSGILSAACSYALENHIERLEIDHKNAAFLSESLSQIFSIEVETHENSTNMVFFHWNHPTITPQQFLQACIKKNLRFSHIDSQRFRAVTHMDVSFTDIQKAVEIVKSIAENH